MEWQIAPRIIDEVRAHMRKGAHLFGFKLLSGVPQDELITAAYGVLLESGATTIFANDEQNLNTCYGVGKDRSARPILREWLAEEIIKMTADEYYRTEVVKEWQSESVRAATEEDLWALVDRSRLARSPEGFVYGAAAYRSVGGFVTTMRGKGEAAGVVVVKNVDHDKKVVSTKGGKATLNAPLLDWIFKTRPRVERVCHYHDYEPELPKLPWAPPGTVRDSQRAWSHMGARASFNVDEHGCFLLYDKEGNLL